MANLIYEKPSIEYIAFYSQEELTATMPIPSIDDYATEQADDDSGNIFSTVIGGGDMEEGIV